MLKKNLILFYILLSSMILIQCQCGDGPTEPTDTTRPTILSITPINNANDVPITDSVVIIFSEKILNQSVSTTSFTVSNKTSTVTLTDSIVVLKFNSPLSYSTTYTVTVLASIEDFATNTLGTNNIFTFTTEVDPATLPPTIISTYPSFVTPLNNITDSITVTFSKDIDPSTINDTTFISADGRTGTVSYNVLSRVAIFKPTTPFAFDSTYTFNITTNVKDTSGSNLQNFFSWNFSTPSVIPQIILLSPLVDSLIIGDSIRFSLIADNPIGIDTVQFFIDNIRTGVDNHIISLGAEFLLDASSFEIGSEHTMYAVVFDSLGNFGHSDTITFFYLWELVMTDGNEGFPPTVIPNDLRKMFVRSTDTTLEFRYEYAIDWQFAYGDTSVDLAVFLDTDFSSSTGRRTNGGDTINDIGAEYRILTGFHGTDTAVYRWLAGCAQSVCWNGFLTPADLYSLNAPDTFNIMEFGLMWSDIGDPIGADIVSINAFFRNSNDPLDVVKDYMPDQTQGHVRVFKNNRYIGPPLLTPAKPDNRYMKATSTMPSYSVPFD